MKENILKGLVSNQNDILYQQEKHWEINEGDGDHIFMYIL